VYYFGYKYQAQFDTASASFVKESWSVPGFLTTGFRDVSKGVAVLSFKKTF
jgi:hypothetical protein